MSDDGTSPGPTRMLFACCATPSTTLSNDSFATYSREPAQQHWPWLKKIALAAPGIAVSISASCRTTLGDLPPNSSDTFFKLPAAACTISFPTSVSYTHLTLPTIY